MDYHYSDSTHIFIHNSGIHAVPHEDLDLSCCSRTKRCGKEMWNEYFIRIFERSSSRYEFECADMVFDTIEDMQNAYNYILSALNTHNKFIDVRKFQPDLLEVTRRLTECRKKNKP